MVDKTQIQARASELFAQGCKCSESVFRAVMEGYGMELTPELRGMSVGFGGGIGGSGCTCGTISGSVMASGYILAHGMFEPGLTRGVAKELHDGFKARHKVTCCRVLTAGKPAGSPERKANCSQLVHEMAGDCVDLLNESMSSH